MNKMFTSTKRLVYLAFCMLFALAYPGTETNAQITNPSPYCGATHNYMGSNGSCYNSYGFNLKRVKLNTMDHTFPCTTSSPSSGPYRFWNTGPTTTLSPGATYTISMQTGNTVSYNVSCAAWIDYNRNNAFDANEAVALSPAMAPSNPSPTYTVSFTVPCTAQPGTTRLRCRADYYYTFSASQGCNNTTYGYGETIDYQITIATAGTPTANFVLPDSVFVNSPATFINSNQAGYISHLWSTSKDGFASQTNITNYTTTFPTAGTYQVKVVSTNCTGAATITKNVVVYNPTSAPRTDFIADRNYIPQAANDPVVDEVVKFYDLSKGGATSWFWELTPGNSSGKWFWASGNDFSQNPQAFFIDTGKFDLCLTATNSKGSKKVCKTGYIWIDRPTSAKFENWMGRESSSSLDSGAIYDDGGPNANYTSNPTVNQTFTINVCEAEEITLYVSAGGYLYYYSNLEIYDGPDVTYPMVKNWSPGGSAPITLTSTKIKLTSGKATIRFWTQYAGYTGAGFEIFWKAKIKNDGPLKSNFTIKHSRNDTIYDCSGATLVNFTNTSSGSRDITERHWIFDYDPNIAYPSGFEDYPDNGDVVNPTFTYYTAPKAYKVWLAQKSCEGWDTIVKSFYLNTTTMLPNVDFTSSKTIFETGGTTKIVNNTVAGCDGLYTWSITPPTGWSFINGTSATSEDIEMKFTTPGRYTVKLTATNDNGTASKIKSDFIRVLSYCTPSASLTVGGIAINNVKFGAINNASGLNPSGYDDFTSSVAAPDLFIGASYPLTVSRTDVFDMADRKVWIDLNRDGDFTTSELVASDVNSTNKDLTANILIPDLNSTTAGLARMRVGITKSGLSLPPCGPTDIGEYEDYMVNLKLDDVPPVITKLGADSIYIEINKPYVDPGATAMDNREGDITSKIVVNNQVDNTQTGVYLVTYNVKDGSGIAAVQKQRFVFVLADMTKPTLTVNGTTTVDHPVSINPYVPYVDNGATAIDNPGSVNISSLIKTNSTVNDKKLGQYEVDYEVTDAYGNKSIAKRIVNVVDVTSPVLNLNGSDPYFVQVNSKFVDPTSATDNYYTDVMPVITAGKPVDATVYNSTYTITYGATDGSGNMATPLTRTFVVGDKIAPVITSVGNQQMVIEVGDPNFVEPPVTATDNFFKSVDLVRNSGGFNPNKLGSYTITYTATDKAGNSTTWTRTIVVVDRTKPAVIAAPVTVQRWTSFDPWMGVSTTDNYYSPAEFLGKQNGCRVEIVASNVDVLMEGYYQVVYQAIDGSGNRSDLKERLVVVTANTTGIDAVNFEKSVNVYPNPNAGNFNVEIAGVVSNNINITITNVTGQTIKVVGANEIVNGKVSVDLGGVSTGVYFVNIQDGNNSVTKKITVTK